MYLKRVHLATAVCTLSVATAGLTFGFSSAATLQIYFNTLWAAFFGSCLNIGGLIGSLLCGALLTRYGPRSVLLISYCPSVLGWVLLFVSSTDVYERYSPTVLFLLGRLLTGLGTGLSLPTSAVYLFELSPTPLRSLVGSLLQVGIVTGIAFTYTVGMYFNWDVVALLSALTVTCLAFFTLAIPESPIWLLKAGQTQTAEDAHLWLYGSHLPPKQETETICLDNSTNLPVSGSGLKHYCFPASTIPASHKSKLRMAYILMVLQQLTGINAVIYFAESVCLFGGAISYRCAFTTGIAQLISSLISIFIINFVSWKKLLQLSAILMTFAHVIYGIIPLVEVPLGILSQICMIIFVFGFSIGWGPLPFLIIMELFPSSVRGRAMSSALSVSWIVGFIITFLLEPWTSWINVTLMFFFFALFCLLGFFYVHRYVPIIKLTHNNTLNISNNSNNTINNNTNANNNSISNLA